LSNLYPNLYNKDKIGNVTNTVVPLSRVLSAPGGLTNPPKMLGICQSQASISEYFGKTFLAE